MRILMLSWEYPPRIVGGISRVVYHLAQELGRAGHQVTVLTMTDEHLAPMEQDGPVTIVRVPAWVVRPISFVDGVTQMNMEMVTAAVRLISSGEHFDVLHMHDWLVALAGKMLMDLYPELTAVCTIHATEFGRNSGIHNDVQSYISSVEQLLVRELSSRVIVNSRYMHEEVARLFSVEAKRLDIIPNGVDPHKFDEVPKDMSLRRCHAADGDRIVFFVGRLTYEKGVHLLMDAVPRVLARYQDVKFIIAGKGQELDTLRQRAWNMGVAHKVDFPGFLSESDLLRMFRIVDIAVFPSLYEPFGIVALEGMVAHLPVVVSDAGGLNEIVENRLNGMKFPSGNAEQLAEAILALLTDGELRRRVTECAYEEIQDRYLWQHIAAMTLKTYEAARG